MELNKMFCDHMVFQANKPFRVFGTGVGTISVKIDGISKVSVSNEDNWLVELPEHNYGGPYTMTVELNGDERIINDIYFLYKRSATIRPVGSSGTKGERQLLA